VAAAATNPHRAGWPRGWRGDGGVAAPREWSMVAVCRDGEEGRHVCEVEMWVGWEGEERGERGQCDGPIAREGLARFRFLFYLFIAQN
jgi:hypothetical protein